MLVSTPLSALREEDTTWDYRGEFTSGFTHLLHSYPAKMIPQVARRLIAQYGHPSGTLLDPFCGSGSVLIEALLAGHEAWGIDLNPLGILVSRVKTTPLDREALAANAEEVIRQAPLLLARGDAPTIEDFNPAFDNVGFWFKPAVIRQLAVLRAVILAIPEQAVRDFFAVALSETARLVSNSRSQEFKLYRYPPEKLREHNPDALAVFAERARRNIAAMAEFAAAVPHGVSAHLVHADAARATTIPAGSIDLVVTSPPYGDSRTTVAYGQFSRLSAQWLYPDLLPAPPVHDSHLLGGSAGRKTEVGLPSPILAAATAAIADHDGRRAREVVAFYRDLYACLRAIAGAVRPGGTLCFVVGNRRVKEVQLPTDLILAELGLALGLEPQQIVVRNIPSKRMPLRNSPSNVPGAVQDTMHKEYIVVMRRL